MFKFATIPSPMSEAFVDACHLFAATFRKVWYIVLVGIIFSLVISQITQGHAQGFNFAHLSSMKNITPGQVVYLVMSFINFIISYYILAVLMHRMEMIISDAKSNLISSLHLAFRKLPILVMNLIIVGVASFAGFVAFVIPGILVVLFTMFTMPAILFDNEGIISAIKSSCQLVWKNFWRTVVVVLIPVSVLYIVGYAVAHFSGMYLGAWAFIPVSIITSILHWLSYALILVQFHDLHIRRELRLENAANEKSVEKK